MLDLIRHDLGLLGIHHDMFASERKSNESGAVDHATEVLRDKGLVYQGVLERPKSLDAHDEWEPVELTLFRSTQFGDDQDRPLKKSDGSWTYFGADAAYHLQKARAGRSFGQHLGRRPCRHGQARPGGGEGADRRQVDLDVKLVQMVRLFRGGEPVKMSKRAGDFVTLAEVVEEVGKDVVRFIMLTRRADAPLDFDFVKVVEASKDNPVFYVQYAHARISSLKRKAADAGSRPWMRPPICRCSTRRSLGWSSARRNIRGCWRAPLWPMNRTASPSSSTIWRPSSTRCGTAATTIPIAASSLKIIHNFLVPGWNSRSASGKSSGAAWG